MDTHTHKHTYTYERNSPSSGKSVSHSFHVYVGVRWLQSRKIYFSCFSAKSALKPTILRALSTSFHLRPHHHHFRLRRRSWALLLCQNSNRLLLSVSVSVSLPLSRDNCGRSDSHNQRVQQCRLSSLQRSTLRLANLCAPCAFCSCGA